MLQIGISHYMGLAAVIFIIGIIGLIANRKNIIMMLLAIELMLLAVNIQFVGFAYYFGDLAGQVFVMFILTVAAAEVAIGLAILVSLYRHRAHIDVEKINELKG